GEPSDNFAASVSRSSGSTLADRSRSPVFSQRWSNCCAITLTDRVSAEDPEGITFDALGSTLPARNRKSKMNDAIVIVRQQFTSFAKECSIHSRRLGRLGWR